MTFDIQLTLVRDTPSTTWSLGDRIAFVSAVVSVLALVATLFLSYLEHRKGRTEAAARRAAFADALDTLVRDFHGRSSSYKAGSLTFADWLDEAHAFRTAMRLLIGAISLSPTIVVAAASVLSFFDQLPIEASEIPSTARDDLVDRSDRSVLDAFAGLQAVTADVRPSLPSPLGRKLRLLRDRWKVGRG